VTHILPWATLPSLIDDRLARVGAGVLLELSPTSSVAVHAQRTVPELAVWLQPSNLCFGGIIGAGCQSNRVRQYLSPAGVRERGSFD